MQVILLERVEKLGQMGDEVKVKNGYARNYLLPQKKALRATDANRKLFETQRKEIEARNLESQKEAEAVAKKLEGKQVVLVRQAGEAGQLYGSVASRDIILVLSDDDINIQRGQVRLDTPIKEIGVYDVKVSLHPEVTAVIKVNVARSEDEAESQLENSAADSFESEELAAAASEKLSTPATDEAAEVEAVEAAEEVADEAPAEESAEDAPAADKKKDA